MDEANGHCTKDYYVFDRTFFAHNSTYVDQCSALMPQMLDRPWGQLAYARGYIDGQFVQCMVSLQGQQWSVDWFGAQEYLYYEEHLDEKE